VRWFRGEKTHRFGEAAEEIRARAGPSPFGGAFLSDSAEWLLDSANVCWFDKAQSRVSRRRQPRRPKRPKPKEVRILITRIGDSGGGQASSTSWRTFDRRES